MQGFGTCKAHFPHVLQDCKWASIQGEGPRVLNIELWGSSACVVGLRIEDVLHANLLMVPNLIEHTLIPSNGPLLFVCNSLLGNVWTLQLAL